jgi:hypothetical protein
MKISTQNGFWSTVVIVAVMALYAANMAGGPTGRSTTTLLIAFPIILAIFLWPVARNFYQVWRASWFPRYTSGRARRLRLPGGAGQSPARVRPASLRQGLSISRLVRAPVARE